MNALFAGPISLEPLTVAHAPAMFDVLSDESLYEYLDYGPPPSLEHLRAVYTTLERRTSTDGKEDWLNWIAVLDGKPIGFVQATVRPNHEAWIAYVFQKSTSRRGYARLSVAAMLGELASDYQVQSCLACVEQANARSIALLESLNFRPASADHADQKGLTPTERLYVRQ